MDVSVRGAIRDAISKSDNPLGKARELLTEEYRKTGGASDIRVPVCAAFEIRRSIAVQAAYERMSGTEWLGAGLIGPEMEDAEEMRWYRMQDGAGFFLKGVPDGVLDANAKARLIALDQEAVTPERFLGSFRVYAPGVGYAVTARKRLLENQDSFLVRGGGRKILAVADGCGSERFSALASHMCVRELAALDDAGAKDVVSISGKVAAMINTRGIIGHCGGLGTSTLLAAVSSGGGKRVFKVGDSIGFAAYEGVVEELSKDREMRNVIGYPGLGEENVECYAADGGQIVLTSDGATNYIPEIDILLSRITAITTDAVIVAERLLRAALANQAAWGHSDDVTIVVEESAD
ncbi:MAG TPA: protein phosphatase 2C domain-containing protein [Candidatus Bilamarchaeum sp.]|nr:protein phosphatase 2C domain-containing protein [Candidatus Bilamarchaeum sp.]